MSDEQQPFQGDPHVTCTTSITACEAKCAELEGKWKRALADLANAEKQHSRDRIEHAKFSEASVLRELLPIVDAVEVASFSPPLPEESQEGVGYGAIRKLLHDLLSHHGVQRIPADGKPDYALHEIVGTRAVEGAEPGVIVEVAQDGYTMHGQCLRPAKVIVCVDVDKSGDENEEGG